MPPMRVTRRNARFQQWSALLENRAKRQRLGEFLVQGVRPIAAALAAGWPMRTILYKADGPLSAWATEILEQTSAERIAVAPELLGELSGKDDGVAELLAVAALPDDDLSRIQVGPSFLGVVFDRPGTPGNIGTMARSADALGGTGLVITGHAADPFDPKSVRASMGSLFALPVVRARSHREVLAWAAETRAAGTPLTIVGTDEHGTADIDEIDLTGPVLLVIGNETAGLSAGWRDGCDTMARIPMSGTASSLNAAAAATVALYEAARQRRAAAIKRA